MDKPREEAAPTATEPEQKQPQKGPEQKLAVQYVDRLDLSEIYADAGTIFFDGQSLRMELCATRLDPTQPASAPRARIVPVCRIALPPTAAIDIFNRFHQAMTLLVAQRTGKLPSPEQPSPEKQAPATEASGDKTVMPRTFARSREPQRH